MDEVIWILKFMFFFITIRLIIKATANIDENTDFLI
jgi:hypothetical protein